MQDILDANIDKELTLRKEASDLIQLILLVLNASHTALPSARWFSTRVVQALRTMSKLNKVRVSYSSTLSQVVQYQSGASTEDHGETEQGNRSHTRPLPIARSGRAPAKL